MQPHFSFYGYLGCGLMGLTFSAMQTRRTSEPGWPACGQAIEGVWLASRVWQAAKAGSVACCAARRFRARALVEPLGVCTQQPQHSSLPSTVSANGVVPPQAASAPPA